ncbi:MAG: hypothetical protein U1F34_04815 [Gammaproteobacteria bacterium]
MTTAANRPCVGIAWRLNTWMDMMLAGDTINDIVAAYPWLELADPHACLAYTGRSAANNERLHPFSRCKVREMKLLNTSTRLARAIERSLPVATTLSGSAIFPRGTAKAIPALAAREARASHLDRQLESMRCQVKSNVCCGFRISR